MTTAAQSFRRTRTAATLLLLAMAAVFLVSLHYQDRHPAIPYLKAFTEAAMIGGLADWFAIVALFRHPFGLPIPHTAIIPAGKRRIGRGLGEFIARTLLTESDLAGLLDALALPKQAGAWLSRAENADALAGWVVEQAPGTLRLLDAFDWPEALLDAAGRTPLAPFLADIIGNLARRRLHHPWLDQALEGAGRFLESHREDLQAAVASHSSKWIPGWVDTRLGDMLVGVLIGTLADLRDPWHRWRQSFDEMLNEFPALMAARPQWQESLAEAQRSLLSDPHWAGELRLLVGNFTETIALDRTLLADQLRRAGERLACDRRWQEVLSLWLLRAAERVLLPRRDAIAGFVEQLVAGWDDRTLVSRMETEVGADLHYIRLNGTLVGGAVGLGLYVLTRLAG